MSDNSNFEITSAAPRYGTEEKQAVSGVIESGYTAEGPQSRKLEDELATYLDLQYCAVASSGSTALHLALESLGVGEGDEVILPAYTCQAVLNSVLQTGASPVFADISSPSLALTAETVAPLLSEKTAAIILVYSFGYPVDDPELFQLDVPVVEDICPAIGAKLDGDPVGGHRGPLAVGSFYATKMLAGGYGGFVATENEALLNEVEDLKKYDERDEFRRTYNYSLSDLQSAVVREQLKKLPGFLARRQEIAQRYERVFENYPEVETPDKLEEHALYRYLVRLDSGDEFSRFMRGRGMEVKRPVFKPLHQYAEFQNRVDLPVTGEVFENTFLIPNHHCLEPEEVDKVGAAIEAFFE